MEDVYDFSTREFQEEQDLFQDPFELSDQLELSDDIEWPEYDKA